jgi:2-iminoacetate synthase
MFPQLKFSEADIAARLAAVTADEVSASLSRERRGFGDLLNLISPAAAACLEPMREEATRCRRRFFGRTVSIYSPLYISNYCVNACKYCDFNIHHQYARKSLSMDEILQETAAIKSLGIDSLLLVSGEHPKVVTAEFLADLARRLRQDFSYLSVEIAPMSEDDYRLLFEAGIEGVTLYQETYNEELYAELHPSGPKRDYHYRIATQERAGKAGMRNLGMGFLLGLYDWRFEAASLAAHAIYLHKRCWQSKIQFSFPRITPISDGFQPPAPVGEAELEQLMLAFRIVFPESDMTISTRERAEFRDRMVQCCAGNMSAGSRVTPGGYAILADQDVGQFTLNDGRSVAEVEAAIRQNGLEVVRKYWDRVI